MSEIKEKIINAADSLFNRFGIRSVSMDDIARELTMSKKTIYQYVADKNEIVKMITMMHLNRERAEFAEVLATSSNALEELYNLSLCLRRHIGEINPSLLFDMQKFHPESWELWIEFKDGFIKNSVFNVIERGKKEGYFRPDINAEILATFRIESIELTFDPNIFPKEKFDFREVQMTLYDHFVHGLLTVKGQEIYDNMVNANG